MRWLLGAMFVLALGVVGCDETTDPSGTVGDALRRILERTFRTYPYRRGAKAARGE